MNSNSKSFGGGEGSRDPVEALADEYVQRLRDGDSPSIDEYVRLYPQLSDAIRELFPTIASMERLKTSKERVRSDGRAALGGAAPLRLGDFRIVREIGRGGMGVVYEAEQESLQRKVAVKVLPRHSLDTDARVERFQQEARTAARLHHTNIIPVFGVGEHNGFHYYVMQLIRGVGLDEMLSSSVVPTVTFTDSVAKRDTKEMFPDSSGATAKGIGNKTGKADRTNSDPLAKSAKSLPSSPNEPNALTPRVVAELGIQAAEALQYAHEQGVLHRDIKPGNLVMDGEGVLFVTDFGLAKVIDQTENGGHERLVGTLRFMAPEQFRGEADARADVYSLGVTLYELLVKQPAFTGDSRNEIVKKISRGDLVPPRHVDSRVPRDLETIVLKACAVDPARRYQTAKDLADDLRCWLEDRPIHARYVSPVERLWSWSRRNPAVAGLAMLASFLLVAVIVTTSWAYVQTKRDLIGETAQRVRTEKTAELSMAALDQVRESVAPKGWDGEKAPAEQLAVSSGNSATTLKKETPTVLESLVAYYENLAELAAANPGEERKAADARVQAGKIHQQLGHLEQAIASYQVAIDHYLGSGVRDQYATLALAKIYNDLGWARRLNGDNEKADAAHGTARDLLVRVCKESVAKPDPEIRFELAHSHYLLARSLRIGESATAWDETYLAPQNKEGVPLDRLRVPRRNGGGPPEHDRPPFDEGPPDRDRPPPFAGGPPDRDYPPHGDGPPPPRGPEGKGRREGGPGAPPPPPPPKKGRPGGGGPKGGEGRPGGQEGGRLPIANNDLREAIDLLEELRHDADEVAKYRHLLAICYRNASANAFGPVKNYEREARRRAIDHLNDLIRDYPNAPEYRYDLAETYAWFDLPQISDEEVQAAIESLRKAAEIDELLVAQKPDVPEYARSYTHVCYKLGAIYWCLAERVTGGKGVRESDEAEAWTRRALQLQTDLFRQFPKVTSYCFWQAKIGQKLAQIQRSRGEYEESRRLLDSSISLLGGMDKNAIALPLARKVLIDSYTGLADTLQELGDKDGAQAARAKSQSLAKP